MYISVTLRGTYRTRWLEVALAIEGSDNLMARPATPVLNTFMAQIDTDK